MIEGSEESKKEDDIMKEQLKEQEKEIVGLDGALKNKEDLLDAIKES